MVPDRSMTTHQNHTINKPCNEEWDGKIFYTKQYEKRCQTKNPNPAHKTKPVLPGLENIDPFKELLPNLVRSRFY
jgi:hypothetical protein